MLPPLSAFAGDVASARYDIYMSPISGYKIGSKKGDFKLSKVAGSDNPADILTKHVSRDIMMKHMTKMGLVVEDGRAKSAPSLQHK